MTSGEFADTPGVPTQRSASEDAGTTLAARFEVIHTVKPVPDELPWRE